MNNPISQRRRYSKEHEHAENLMSSPQWPSNQTGATYSEPSATTGNVKMYNIQQTQPHNLPGTISQWDQPSQGNNTLLQSVPAQTPISHQSDSWQCITSQSSNVDPWNWDIEGSQGNPAVQSSFIPSVQNWQQHTFHHQPQQVTSQAQLQTTTTTNSWTEMNQSLENVNQQHEWNYPQHYFTENTSNNNSYNWQVEQPYNTNEYQWYGHQKPFVHNQSEKLENSNQFAENTTWNWEKHWTDVPNLESSQQAANQSSQVIPQSQSDSGNASITNSISSEFRSEVQNFDSSVNISSEVSENNNVKNLDSSDCNKGLSVFFNNDNTNVDYLVPTTETPITSENKDNSSQETNQNNASGDKLQETILKEDTEGNSQLINDNGSSIKEFDSSSRDDVNIDEMNNISEGIESLTLNSSIKETETFPIEEPINQEVPEPSADISQIESNSSQRQRGVGDENKTDSTKTYRNADEPINQQIPDIVPVFPSQSNSDICRNNSADVIQQERGTVIKPREGSPFKPPSKLFLSGNIIQQEIEQNTLQDSVPISTAQEVNLETVPENLEHPPDGEILSHQSSWHASLHRHHNHQRCSNSPSTTLWDNPDLPSVTFVPAAPLLSETIAEKETNVKQNVETDSLECNVNNVSRQSPLGWEGYQTDVKKQASVPISAAEQVVSDVKSNDQLSTLGPPPPPPVLTMELLHRTSPQGAGHIQQQVKTPAEKSASEVPYSHHDDRINSQLAGDGGKSRYDDLSSERIPRQDTERFSTQRVVSGHGSVSDREILRDRKEELSQSRDSLPNQSTANEEQIGRWDRSYGNRRPEEDRRRGHYPPEMDRSNRNETWDRRSDSRHYADDKRYSSLDERDYYSERDRSRPSSRTSLNESIDGQERYYRDRDYRRIYYQDRIRTPTSESERGNWSSDRKYYRNSGYDRDPVYNDRYSAYRRNDDPYRSGVYRGYNYDMYRQDPHAYYRYYDLYRYGYNNYNFGYYDELYRNDPRYQAQLDERYQEYYAQMSRETDYERLSVHSGRSSVNDELQKDRQNRYAGDLDQSSVGGSDYSNYHQYDSNYGVDYTNSTTLTEREQSSTARLTPTKFSCPHPVSCFSPGGLFITVFTNLSETVRSSNVQIHSMQELFPVEDECVKELQIFPGPLQRGKTHKNDVIQFCQKKIQQLKTKQVTDRESCILLWELMIRLLRQNGCVAGTDVAELLLNNHEILNPVSKRSADVTHTDGTLSDIGESTKQISTADTPSPDEGIVVTHDRTILNSSESMNIEKVTQKFREFLLFGGKQDALEWAMKHNLWGHALFLASKMDPHNYANVMKRFANSLAPNDPLQTLYQLMSGRQPASVTRIVDEKWGDWRPHLAMILSNPSSRTEVDLRSITTLGDTLASLGCLSAAHFCYLMAQLDFGSYSSKSSKLVLLGSSNLLPFQQFASNEAIQCTEIYEYAQTLANPEYVLPHLQAYKFIYATRLVEYGFPQEALHYCEMISQTFHKLNGCISLDLINQVYNLADKLKYHDPHFTQGQGELEELGDPIWLINLKKLCSYTDDYSLNSNVNNADNISNVVDSSIDTSQFVKNNSEVEQISSPFSETQNFSQQQYQMWRNENNQFELQTSTNIQDYNAHQINSEQQYQINYSQWNPEKPNIEEKSPLVDSVETNTTEIPSQQNITNIDYYSASLQQDLCL
ncbi:uncharacterized protein Sec16 isoform X3 [Centruroides vittatus]|uniref:uncharacterized protein Sec16 isoform X3 n=1 Tax=Centruroides vittatus TaxID=120091 RepID=UPI00350EB756